MNHKLLFALAFLLISFFSGMLGSLLIVPRSSDTPRLASPLRQNVTRTYQSGKDAEILAKIAPSIVRVVSTRASTLSNRSVGVIISSDGWIIAHGLVEKNDISILDYENALFEVKNAFYHPGLDITFIQTNKSNAKPVEMLATSELTDVLEGLLLFGNSSVEHILLTPVGYPFSRIASDSLKVHELAKRFNYDQPFAGPAKNVFTTSGIFVGFTSEYGIIPMVSVTRALPQIFKNKKLILPTLPLLYHDTAWLPYEKKQKQVRSIGQGALLAGSRQTHYRLESDTKKQVLLAGGDLISAVNGERLDRNRGLSDVVAQYHVGDVLSVHVRSAKEKKEQTLRIKIQPFIYSQ